MRQYRLLDLKNLNQIDLGPSYAQTQPGGTNFKPIVTIVNQNESLLVLPEYENQSALGVSMSFTGEPLRGVLSWPSYPRAIGVEFPYVIALLRNNTIEIHDITNQKLVQTIRLPTHADVRSISQGPGTKIWVGELLEKLKWERVFSYKQHPLEAANGLPGEDTVVPSKNDGCFIDDASSRIAEVPTRLIIGGRESVMALASTPWIVQVDQLLDMGCIEEALDLTERVLQNTPPNLIDFDRQRREVSYVYQRAAFICLGQTLLDDARNYFERGSTDPRLVIRVFGDLRDLVEEDEEMFVSAGIKGVIDQLGTIEDIVLRTLSRNYDPHIKPDAKRSPATQELRKKLVENADEMLHKFLTKDRRDRNFGDRTDRKILKAVDNTLVQLCARSNADEQLIEILEGENACTLEACEDVLLQHEKYYALSLLYKNHQRNGETLLLWQRMYNKELQDHGFQGGLDQIAAFLYTLEDADLVWEYAIWVAEKEPMLGAQIFMQPDLKKPLLIEPAKVLDGLRRVGPSGLSLYLEHLIRQRKSNDERYHTEFATLQIQGIQDMLKDEEGKALLEATASEFSRLGKSTTLTFLSYLGSRPREEKLNHARAKLIVFLQASGWYNFSVILDLLTEINVLYAERAVVHGKLKQHEKALRILIDNLKDYRGAETYCFHAGRTIGVVRKQSERKTSEDKSLIDTRRMLFLILIKVYIEMRNTEHMVENIVHLLNKHAAYLDILEVLNLLPESWSVEMLNNFLVHSLRQNYHDYRESQILKGIIRGENFMIDSRLYETYQESGPIVITPTSKCSSCKNVIGDNDFVRRANSEIVHLTCRGDDPHQTQQGTNEIALAE